MSYLVDTNVLSEAGKTNPDLKVEIFLLALTEAWVSVITLHEIDFGIARLPIGRRKTSLNASMKQIISNFGDRIIPVRPDEARIAAAMRADAVRRGRVLEIADALIAATAKEYGLTVATRNRYDFQNLGVEVFDPWHDTP